MAINRNAEDYADFFAPTPTFRPGRALLKATRLFSDPPPEAPERILQPLEQAEIDRRVIIYTAQCQSAGGWTKNVQHIWWINKAVAKSVPRE
jgi:hypothetical protein